MTTLSFKGYTIDVESMSPKGVFYLLNNGFKQSMSDCIAGMGKKLSDEGLSQDEVSAKLKEVQDQRYSDILSGEVGTRDSGPRLQGVDKFIAQVAEEALRKKFAKDKIQWPTGEGAAKQIAELREKALAGASGNKIRAEGKRRFELEQDIEV